MCIICDGCGRQCLYTQSCWEGGGGGLGADLQGVEVWLIPSVIPLLPITTILVLLGRPARTTPTLVGGVESIFLEFLGKLFAVASIRICPFILIVIRAFLLTLYSGRLGPGHKGGVQTKIQSKTTHFLMAASRVLFRPIPMHFSRWGANFWAPKVLEQLGHRQSMFFLMERGELPNMSSPFTSTITCFSYTLGEGSRCEVLCSCGNASHLSSG